MKVVIDASVAVQWFFRTAGVERDGAAALDILHGVAQRRLELLQPPHFIAEVSAVLARESASTAKAALASLLDVEMLRVGDSAVFARAVDLSIRLEHHLFDTLYHAVALESRDAVLVTADERYYRKASRSGRIVRLADFDASLDPRRV